MEYIYNLILGNRTELEFLTTFQLEIHTELSELNFLTIDWIMFVHF